MVRLKRRRATSKGSFSRTRTLGMFVESLGNSGLGQPVSIATSQQLRKALYRTALYRTVLLTGAVSDRRCIGPVRSAGVQYLSGLSRARPAKSPAMPATGARPCADSHGTGRVRVAAILLHVGLRHRDFLRRNGRCAL